MTRGRIVFLLLSIALLVPIATGTLSRAATQGEDGQDSLYKNLSVFSEVLNLIRRAYVEETSVDRLFSGAFEGATDALDPLSTFIPEEAVEAYLETLRIGAGRSGVTLGKERGIAHVVAAAAGSPGQVVGLRRGDIIAKVGGHSTRRMALWELQGLFAGEPGTELELEVLRRGQTELLTLALAEYEPPTPIWEDHDGIAVLRLYGLGKGSDADVRVLLEDLSAKSRDKLVVDVRGVAAGDLETAYALGDLFATGKLGELRDRHGVVASFEGTEEVVWAGRLVVLTDRGSQGASEILAAVLSQSASAQLVGERTFGHAGRQTLAELSGGARVLFPDAFYTGPDGEAIARGLEPEVEVSDASRRLSESSVEIEDLILKRGLEILADEEPVLEKVA